MSFRNNKNLNIVILLAIVTLFSFLPLFNSTFYRMDDIYFDMLRIESTKDALIQGIFPLKIAPHYLNNYGYGIGFFYCPLFIYPAAFLKVIGFSTVTSFKLFLVGCGFAATASMYFAAYKITAKKYFALIATILYTTSHYKIIDTIYRGAIGETLVFIFLPFAILGVHEMLYGDGKKWSYLAIGMSGIFLSHVLASLLLAIYLVISYLIRIKLLWHEKYRILNSLKAIGITLLLSAFYWIPMFEQMFHSRFSLNTSIANINSRGFELASLFDTKMVNQTIDTPYSVGFVLISIGLFAWIYRIKLSAFMKTSLILGYCFFFLTLKSFFWTLILPILPFFNQIQFPWRFNMLATPLLALGGAAILYQLFFQERTVQTKHFALTAIILGVFGYVGFYTFQFPYQREVITFDEHYFDKPNLHSAIGAGEYLPKGTSKRMFLNRGVVFKHDGNILLVDRVTKKKNNLSFDYFLNMKEQKIDVPLVYYYGYRYKIIQEDGTESKSYPVSESNDHTVQINTKSTHSGTISIDYVPTLLTKIAYGITFTTLVGISFFYIKTKKFPRK